jgi:hypothetical protein
MATEMIFSVFEDFNEPSQQPALPEPEAEAATFDLLAECREQAWTEGYLTARREYGGPDADQPLTAKLLTSLHELDGQTSLVVDAASLAVADLLVNTVLAATADNWSARLLERVKTLADRIKPALTVAPEFIVRDQHGATQRFADISELSLALEDNTIREDVTIKWHHGEATISRTAILEDLQAAIIPLSAGLVDEQNARHKT